MSRVFQALTAEPWAIVPSELQKIAAIVQRHSLPDAAAKGEPEYQKRDYQLMAGPGAQRLAGTSRAFLVDGVAILPITGPIFPRANMMTEYSGATSINTLTDDYRKALDSSDVGAILLLVDSPGGAVSGINAFADIVAAGAKKKYTTAFVAGSAASAAYWIASAASEIAMERTGMVGSIGVVAAIPVQVAPDAGGDLWIEIVSSNAPNKRPDPVSEDGRIEIVATLDAVEKQFVADVARGRKTTVEKVLADFGRGGVKVGADAVKAGMADKVQSYDAALNALRRMVANQRKLAALRQN
jgi:ClpP class serine protease